MSTTVDENIIYISSKKNIIFYLNICKAYLTQHDTIILKACGSAMSTAMIIVEMLKRKHQIGSAYYETSTLENTNIAKTQLSVHISKRLETDPEDVTVTPPNSPTQKTNKIYISLSKNVHFYIKLLEHELKSTPCAIYGTGRCISNVIVLYEYFRQRPDQYKVGNFQTCSKEHLIDDKNKIKTQCCVTITKSSSSASTDASVSLEEETVKSPCPDGQDNQRLEVVDTVEVKEVSTEN